jgi:hypothetical protein
MKTTISCKNRVLTQQTMPTANHSPDKETGIMKPITLKASGRLTTLLAAMSVCSFCATTAPQQAAAQSSEPANTLRTAQRAADNKNVPASTLLKRDAFYDPPAQAPDKPGMLIRSEPLTDRTLPENAKAWRILYTTAFAEGRPGVSAGIVMAPVNPPEGPRPVILWEHGAIGTVERRQLSLTKNPIVAYTGDLQHFSFE